MAADAEAARAGKGFAVVASGAKSLATRGETVGSIGEMARNVQEASSGTNEVNRDIGRRSGRLGQAADALPLPPGGMLISRCCPTRAPGGRAGG